MESAVHTVAATIEPSFADVMKGTFKVEGELSCSTSEIIFEFRKVGLFRRASSAQRWTVPFDNLREVRQKRLRVVVSPRSLQALDGLPGDNSSSVKFRIDASDRLEARRLANYINDELSDRREYEITGVPFRLPDVSTGLREVGGVVYLEPDLLVLDLESGLPGGARRDRFVIKMETGTIASVTLRRGIVYDRIVIRTSNQSHFDQLPWPVVGKLTLRIGRRHRAESESIVRVVNMRMDLPVI